MSVVNEPKTPGLRFRSGKSTSWTRQRLGDFVETSSGGTPSRAVEEYFRGSIKWFTTTELQDCGLHDSLEHISEQALNNSSAKIFPPNTILMAMYGATIGRLGILHDFAATNQACCAMSCGKALETGFLFYYLQYLRKEIIERGCGAGQPNISQEIVQSLPLALPSSLSEQREIGTFFRGVDALLAGREKAIGRLEALKKAMLLKMFPQGKANTPEVRFKGVEGAWKRKKFGVVVSRKSTMSGDLDLPRLEYEDIVSFQGTLNKDIGKKQSDKKGILFSDGDVLFGKLRPYLGNWFLPNFKGLAVGDWWVLHPENGDARFLYMLIQTSGFQAVANQSSGSKMPRADWKLVADTEFALPSLPEQRIIGKYFRTLDELLAARQEEVEKLKQLKEGLLERMFA